MHIRLIWTQQQHQLLSETTKHEYPELDDKSSKENVNIYILIIFIDIILVRITMKKIIFTKTEELTNIS